MGVSHRVCVGRFSTKFIFSLSMHVGEDIFFFYRYVGIVLERVSHVVV